jgi:hypothetical protein
VSAAGTVSGVSKQETASLDCQVDADPSNEVHFWWTFLGTPMKSKSMIKHNNNKNCIIIDRLIGHTQYKSHYQKIKKEFKTTI